MQRKNTSTAKKTPKGSASKATAKKATAKKTPQKKTAAKKTAAASAVKKAPAKKTSIKTKKAAIGNAGAVKAEKSSCISDPTLDIIKKCRDAMDDKKAENIKILDVRGKSPITNYFIIATATSTPHLRALAGELEKTLKDLGVKAIGRDYNSDSGWVVVDGFDFMAHIFLPEERGMYGIESLWKDADIVDF